MNPDQEFYVGQKAFIEKDGKVLVIFYSGGVDFPGGKIQIGESSTIDSLKREVLEESNLEIEVGKPFHTWSFQFDKGSKNEGKKVFMVGYRCKHKSGEVRISTEHKSFEWVSKEEIDQFKKGSKEYTYQALKIYFQEP